MSDTQPRPQEKHTQPPPVESDETVQHIAEVLLAATTVASAVAGLSALLAPYKIGTDAIEGVLSMLQGGTAHRPNARLALFGVQNVGNVKVTQKREIFFRAAYFANACKRIQRALNSGESLIEAIKDEDRFFEQHEAARRGRLDAAAQVEYAANLFGWKDERGTLVGWYLNPFLNNEIECQHANGHNFYAEEGTIIGLPGSVHANCGCYAGTPHQGASLVNDALRNVVILAKRQKPKFKLKESKKHA